MELTSEEKKKSVAEYGLRFDAMNSNTFQDQPGQALSYKFGSMQHVDNEVRKQAIEHNIEVIARWHRIGTIAIISST